MKKKIIMISVTGILIISNTLIANATTNFNSQGKIVFTNGTDDAEDDVIFDAGDFARLATVCE